jgi:hypothetical protein
MSGKAWIGDWQGRVADRVRSKGFSSLQELARAQPTHSFTRLARELGPDIAALQVESLLFDEAVETGSVAEAVKDSLVRCLNAYLPGGWPHPGESSAGVTSAYDAWSSHLPSEYEEACARVWNRLRALARPTWRPTNHEDPLLLEACAKERFVSAAQGPRPRVRA